LEEREAGSKSGRERVCPLTACYTIYAVLLNKYYILRIRIEDQFQSYWRCTRTEYWYKALSGKETKVADSMVDVGVGAIQRMMDGKVTVASTGTPSAKGDRIKQTRCPLIVVEYTSNTRAL
jgi:hypothetical protein